MNCSTCRSASEGCGLAGSTGSTLDLLHHSEEDLRRLEIGRSRAVDELGDDGFTLGDLAALPVLGDETFWSSASPTRVARFFAPRGRP
jgi:hypothetical protein